MNVVVVRLEHGHARMEFNPVADTVIQAGALLLAGSETLKHLERAAK